MSLLQQFRVLYPEHEAPHVYDEHDQQWVVCSACGAMWSVVDTSDGPDFDLLEDGDESCRDNDAA